MTKKKFTREVEITPAFDKRDPDPHKDYGVHGCDLRMILKGAAGAVQFLLFTNWHLPHVTEGMVDRLNGPHDIKIFMLPLPADVGYHSRAPMYEGQEPTSDSCSYIGGKSCYYDGSGLQAEKVYDILLREGSEGVWKYLEKYYNETFGEGGVL